MLLTPDNLGLRTGVFLIGCRNRRRRRPQSGGCFKASLITDSDSFQVGKLIGTYGFINITSYSGLQSELDKEYLPEGDWRFRAQDIGEANVRIRLYEGRVAQGPLRGTPVIFKVYPGKQVGGPEADMMAANELSAHASLQASNSEGMDCANIQILLGGFETKMGEQWLAFRNDGKYTAADYGKVSSERISLGRQWNRFEREETIKRKRRFVIKLLQGAMKGLAYMHEHERLHQSLGPASVVLNTLVEKDATYLVPRLRDLAFSVDLRNACGLRDSKMEGDSDSLAGGLWRRAYAAGALNPLEKRAFGMADDIYEAGLLVCYMAFVPFCEAGAMDSLSLRRLLENTFQLDVEALREYCLADERLAEAVEFLDVGGGGAGWELLGAMVRRDYRERPTAETVVKHRFM
ncbi:hypothetical protein M569_05692, partial [Genlisea aurea]